MIFVTGGTGLVGSHVLLEVSLRCDYITAIYRDSSKIKLVEKLFHFYYPEKGILFFQKIRWVKCDILDIQALDEVMRGHTTVLHCAGYISFHKQDFSKLIEVNRYGTKNIVNTALTHCVDYFCFVSSIAAIGNSEGNDSEYINEKSKWKMTEHVSGYSFAKYSAEKEVWRGINEGLNAVIVNPGVILGAGDWKKSSLSIFQFLAKKINFYPTGIINLVDARDVAKIMWQLTENKISEERFICVGATVSYKTFFETTKRLLGINSTLQPISKQKLIMVRKLLQVKAILSFSRNKITKEVVHSSFSKEIYSSHKVSTTLQYCFLPLEDSIQNVIDFHEIRKQ